MIACLFAPKLYIILVHPERNVRQSMMPGANRQSMGTNAAGHHGGATGTSSVTMAAGGPIALSVFQQNHVGFVEPVKKTDQSTQTDDGKSKYITLLSLIPIIDFNVCVMILMQ